MKSRLSMVLALAFTSTVGVVSYAGCSSDPSTPVKPANEAGTGGLCDMPKLASGEDDLENPPVKCAPDAPKCTSQDKVASCPSNECMYAVEQTTSTKSFRLGRIRLWAPDALLSLTGIAVDPNVRAKCANAGTESFTWLAQVDETKKTIKTGGSRASTGGDGKNFAFLDESVNAAALDAICPGFKGPTEPISLRPVVSDYTVGADGSLTTPKIELINVPIFDTSGLPIILPLREAQIKNATIKGSCVGAYSKDFWCDGDSEGWTTGGAIIAKITAEEADKVPVKSAGCQSLCAILVNDATKTDGKVCKKVDGKIPEIGTHCVGGATCKNAFLLSPSPSPRRCRFRRCPSCRCRPGGRPTRRC